MTTIETHTAQADAHANAIRKAVKGAKYPLSEKNSITYSDGASILQGQECVQTFSNLVTTLKNALNTDADHIQEINQTFVDKNEEIKKGLMSLG